MSALTNTQLLNEIANKILTGGRQTIAQNTRQVLNEMVESTLNVVDGGYVQQAEVGYSNLITLVDDRAFAHKKYVDDAVNTAIQNPYSSANGITNTLNVFELGGALNQHTNITGAIGTFDLNLGNAIDRLQNFGIYSSSSNTLNFNNGSVNSSIEQNGTNVQFYQTLGLDTTSFILDHQNARIYSVYSGFQGIQEFADYSANYSSLSLVNKSYVDNLVVGLLDDRGGFDASGNLFPAAGGSGFGGAILKGDIWYITVAGTLGGSPVGLGDTVRAIANTPGQTAANWSIMEYNIGYVPENIANKATSFVTLNNTLYPTTQAVSNLITSGYVPYTGATSTLNLGSQNFVTTGTSSIGGGANLGFLLSVSNGSSPNIGIVSTGQSGLATLFMGPATGSSGTNIYHSGNLTVSSGLYLKNSWWMQTYSEQLLFNNGLAGTIVFATGGVNPSNECIRIDSTQNVSISGNATTKLITPTAYLHLAKAIGGVTINSASLKFESATALLTVPEPGAVEFLTDAWYGTITTGGIRKTFAFLESPIFTTNITTPLIIGGTLVGSVIQYKGTTGIGTSTVAAHQFLVGTNGATSTMRIYNSGGVNIGNATNNTAAAGILRVGQGSSFLDFGEVAGAPSIWFNAATPSVSNYGFRGTSSALVLNASSSVSLYIGTGDGLTLFTNRYTFYCSTAATSGNILTYDFSPPANTGQTASVNSPTFKLNGNTKTKATGADSLQYFNWWTSHTQSYVGASILSLGANSVFEYMQGGTNATVTTSAAIYVPTKILTNTTTSYAALLEASTGAVTNWALGLIGNISLTVAGNGIYIKEGTNASSGLGTLVGGTITISTTKVTSNSRIILTGQGGNISNLGSYSVTSRTPGTSFVITSSNVLDTNTVSWLIIEPA